MLSRARLSAKSLLRRLLSPRFLRFGTVGASGVVVNESVLHLGEKYIFTAPAIAGGTNWLQLNQSLALAIFFATLNNFFWNRKWTWADRAQFHGRSELVQFGQYSLSCGLSIALQFLFTNLLAPHVSHLTANLISIGITSVLNFLLNDFWTFGRHSAGAQSPLGGEQT